MQETMRRMGQCGLVIGMTLLACACSKKGDDAAGGGGGGGSAPAVAATGIKGKIAGKPFAPTMALLQLDSEGGSPTLYLLGRDAKCTGNPSGPLGIPPKGINEAHITAPLKKGAQLFVSDKVDGSLAFWNEKGALASSINTPKGDVEWLTLPTDKTKGVIRVNFALEGNDTKFEGTIEVAQCPKT